MSVTQLKPNCTKYGRKTFYYATELFTAMTNFVAEASWSAFLSYLKIAKNQELAKTGFLQKNQDKMKQCHDNIFAKKFE